MTAIRYRAVGKSEKVTKIKSYKIYATYNEMRSYKEKKFNFVKKNTEKILKKILIFTRFVFARREDLSIYVHML